MLNGYVPAGMPLAEAIALRTSDPDAYVRRARETAVRHVQAMLDMQDGGSHVFDYGNNLRTEARDAGLEGAFGFPGFVPAYVRPLFCVGAGPVPLGGALGRSRRHRAASTEPCSRRSPTTRCCSGGCTSRPTGSRSRACRRGSAGSATATAPSAGLIFNDLVRRGEVSAPIVIGRDHLDTGSVASPFRETEAMRDGSDAIADWPILNALLSASSGASWVSVHHGGGVGIGNSIHAGMVIVADGTPEMDERLARVLTNDPGIGVARHADAGYEDGDRDRPRTWRAPADGGVPVSGDGGADGGHGRLGARRARPVRRAGLERRRHPPWRCAGRPSRRCARGRGGPDRSGVGRGRRRRCARAVRERRGAREHRRGLRRGRHARQGAGRRVALADGGQPRHGLPHDPGRARADARGRPRRHRLHRLVGDRAAVPGRGRRTSCPSRRSQG